MQNLSILQSKLKRHKINHTVENNTVTIGSAKKDYFTFWVLGVFPLAVGVLFLIYTLSQGLLISSFGAKVGVAIIGLASMGVFNLNRLKSKKTSNNNEKVISDNCIILRDAFGEHTFTAQDIYGFHYQVEQITNEVYEGNMYLIDSQERAHQLLGFDDEHESYVINDLKWFADYFSSHFNVAAKDY